MANERIRTKQELKNLFTNLRIKGITDDMISILIDALWRDKPIPRTSGFYDAGGWNAEISFDANTRIFSIKPFDPLVESFEPRYLVFSWSNEAHPHRIFETHEIEIPNEEGLFFLYFDKEPEPSRNLMLFVKKNPTEPEIREIMLSKIMIASLYWDAANDELLYFGNDKHGSEWNPQLQWYLHTTQGAQRKTGLTFAGYSLDGDGTLNDHAKFNIVGGIMYHDDFELSIPTSGYTIPVMYAFGGVPRFITNNGYAFATGSRAYFNSGLNTLVQVDSGNFVCYHIFATNEILNESRKIASVMGISQYETLAEAYQGVKPELDAIVTYMPHQGRCYLGSIIIQTSDDFTNHVKARIVALTGNESHPPVSIAPGSELYLAINDKQELSIDVDALPGGETHAYEWNLHSPDQITGYLNEPENLVATINGTGTVVTTIAAGTYVITALNDSGETLPVDVPEMVILDDTTSIIISWDAIPGATGYRVYEVATGNYYNLPAYIWDYYTQIPVTAGTIPLENTAAIYQSAFTISNGDAVKFTGEGIDVETSTDEADATKKYVLLKKQRSDWNATEGPNVIDNKPIISGNDEVTADNGLTKTLTNVQLGGAIIKDTIIGSEGIWGEEEGKYIAFKTLGNHNIIEEVIRKPLDGTGDISISIGKETFDYGLGKSASSGEYAYAEDADGNIWFAFDLMNVSSPSDGYTASNADVRKIIGIEHTPSIGNYIKYALEFGKMVGSVGTYPFFGRLIITKGNDTIHAYFPLPFPGVGWNQCVLPISVNGINADQYGNINIGSQANGITPHIGINGNWWIGETDTGVKAQGEDGEPGTNGTNGTNGIDAGGGFEFCVTGGVAQTETLDIYASQNFTIDKLVAECDGTLTSVTVKIGATAVTGINAVSVSTLAVFTATAANAVVTGNRITIEIGTGYSGTPTIIKGKLICIAS